MEFTEAWEHTCSAVGIAAREGQLSELKKLIYEDDKPVDVADNRGWRPLHEAAAVGKDLRCLEELLKHKDTNVNWQTHEGESALLLACKRRKGNDALEAAKLLIKSGADVNLVDNEQESALLTATRAGLASTVQILLTIEGVQTDIADFSNWTPLHDAANNGYLEIMQYLIQAGAQMDVRDECGMTPIFTAAQKGRIDCLRFLLETAKSQNKMHLVNCGAEDFATPLLIAAQQGFLECVEMLLVYGADPDIKTEDNVTALHLVVQNDHISVLQLLSKHMDMESIKKQSQITNPSQPKPKMINPLHLAVEQRSYECLRFLLENGFSVDSLMFRKHLPNEHYYVLLLPRFETPLSLAVAKGDLISIKILVEAGADCDVPFLCAMHPITTLFLADQNNRNVESIFQLLVQHGASLNYQRRGPPINCSIISAIWNPELFLLILNHGANPELCFQDELSTTIFVEALFKACISEKQLQNRLNTLMHFVDSRSIHLKMVVHEVLVRSELSFGVDHNPLSWASIIATCNNVLPLLCICRIHFKKYLHGSNKLSDPQAIIERLNMPFPLHSFLNCSDLRKSD